MKSSIRRINGGTRLYLVLLIALISAVLTSPALSRAKLQATITATNDSSREIDHLYTSPLESKEWSVDQLPSGSNLHRGESSVLSNVICESDQIKVIAEDKEGCFMYGVVSCSDASTWTITDNTPRDCGN